MQAGPSTLAILVCVRNEDIRQQLHEKVASATSCTSHTSFVYIGATLIVMSQASQIVIDVDKANHQSCLDELGNRGAKRLIILFATSFSGTLAIPNVFQRCEMYSCNGAQVHLLESTYCDATLDIFHTRSEVYACHTLIMARVSIEVSEYSGPKSYPPFDLQNLRVPEIKSEISNHIMPDETNDKRHDVLPWLAGFAAGASTAAYIIWSVEFAVEGVYIVCQVGSCAISGTALAVVGISSLAVGLGTAAIVYYIPWRKLAQWFSKAWSYFIRFLVRIWDFVKHRLATFLERVFAVITDLYVF